MPETKPRMSRWGDLRSWAGAVGWGLTGVFVVSVVGQRAWPIELTTHFWPQLLILLSVGGLLAAAARLTLLAGLQGLAAVGLGAMVLGSGTPTGSAGQEQAITVFFANVERRNPQSHSLLERIRAADPDVIALAETDSVWLAALGDLRLDYPHQVARPRSDNFGIALLSRWPLEMGEVVEGGELRLPSIVARVDVRGSPWRVIVTHPIPPATPRSFSGRNSQLAWVADRLGATPMRTIVVGDLNGTRWSPYVRDLTSAAGLQPLGRGLRSLYTWPVGAPLLALQLDQCLVSHDVQGVEYRVLESIGSDHYPILCRVVDPSA